MPRRSVFSSPECARLLAVPDSQDELIQHYTLSESDLSLIRQRRGAANRLGFAVHLCYHRYPGVVLGAGQAPHPSLLKLVAEQLNVDVKCWDEYGQRDQTRREHLVELQAWMQLSVFSAADFRRFVHQLTELAAQTDRGIVLAETLVEQMRQQRILLPSLDVIERICSEALIRGARQVYAALVAPLTDAHRGTLDTLLNWKEAMTVSVIFWLRQAPGAPKSKHILIHLERLKTIVGLQLPEGIGRAIHQNRLLKLAREGSPMTSQHLRDLEPDRRYATLVAMILDTHATLIDEIIDMHDRFMGTLFSKAKRKHDDQFQKDGKSINDKVRLYTQIGRALLAAKEAGTDAFAAIESVLPWEEFSASITAAEKLAQPEAFDFLELIGDRYAQLRRYSPIFLEALTLKASPSAVDLLAAVEILKELDRKPSRKLPDDAPVSFVRKRWKNLVHTESGLDRRFYEICVFSELQNALRSGDIWVQGSRQFKAFDEFLLPPPRFAALRDQKELGLAIETNCDTFLTSRLELLDSQLAMVEKLATANQLPDAVITSQGRLKITPLDKAVPDEVKALSRQVYSLLPHLKITELLLEVDSWTGFTSHFKHLKDGEAPEDQHRLLTTILADAINLGLSKMAECCPGTTYARLSWLQAWPDQNHGDAPRTRQPGRLEARSSWAQRQTTG
jgi:hypothetical protein